VSSGTLLGRLHRTLWLGPFPENSESVRFAARDVAAIVTHWRVWVPLGWHDIRQRYHRTALGPFWITLSMAAMITSLGLVFGTIFKTQLSEYLPFLAAGLITWNLVSTIGNDATSAFTGVQGLIKSVALPFTVHVCRVVARNFFIFVHNLVAFVVVMILFDVPVTTSTLCLVPNLLLVFLNAVWLTLLAAMIGTRYRDVQQIVSIILQFVFFLTPIIWHRGQIPHGRLYWVDANPFYHVVELLRAPMLGQMPTLASYLYCVALLAVGGVACFLAFALYRRRIAYWV
jgi:lipopolysaccharide transport system permease protein